MEVWVTIYLFIFNELGNFFWVIFLLFHIWWTKSVGFFFFFFFLKKHLNLERIKLIRVGGVLFTYLFLYDKDKKSGVFLN